MIKPVIHVKAFYMTKRLFNHVALVCIALMIYLQQIR